MQPIWDYLYLICLDFLLQILNNLLKDPIINIKEVKEEANIKITKNISYKFEKSSIINPKDLSNVLGRFSKSKLLLGIK